MRVHRFVGTTGLGLALALGCAGGGAPTTRAARTDVPPRTRPAPLTSAAPASPSRLASVDRSRLLSVSTLVAPDIRAMGGCLTDTGCPERAVPLPPCPAELRPRSPDSVIAEAASWLHRDVVVEGPLRPASATSTSTACSTCCNHVSVAQKVGTLTIDADCVSDDSSHPCCAFQTPETVVAVGRLERNPRAPESFVLTNVALCTLADVASSVPPAPPDDVVFAELGCFVSGRAVPPYGTFRSGDRRCGCFDGAVSCEAPSERCFDRGQWYDPGKTVAARRPVEVQCLCEQGEWSCPTRDRLPFARVELDGNSIRAASFEPIAAWLADDRRRAVELEVSGPSRQARVVRDALLQRGFTARQIRIAGAAATDGAVIVKIVRAPR